MKAWKASPCTVEGQQACTRWIHELFKDRVCNLNDAISFGLGMSSLVCWAVAEIPQIITNFNNKSAAGVSLAFLSTWILGDVFNLVGCILEPATLPTQFYTALLYTVVTIILALQCIYYNHFLQWFKRNKKEAVKVNVIDETEPLQDRRTAARRKASVEIPDGKDFYFMSARSLSRSETPPNQCYIRAWSGPPTLEHHTDSSSDEEDGPVFRPPSIKSVTQPRPIPRPARYGTFAAASAHLLHLSRAHGTEFSGRGILQERKNAYGQWLGWLMAAIYMGGRIPQIWLNIKRGSVEGLNPLMFVFALVANATYVGSILVRNSEWWVIKANMPWLLDAIVCVGLDLLVSFIVIILQYIFYKYVKLNRSDRCGDYYVEADKPTS